MKFKQIGIIILLITTLLKLQAGVGQSFDKTLFYSAIESNNIDKINEQLKTIKSLTFLKKEAYQGALTMKKADLVKGASAKLGLFKSGNKMLENAIKSDNANVEFRFLRLMIQENAPGILNYKKELPEDANLIKEKFKNLPKVVQEAIRNYSKNSKILNPTDFNS